MNQTSLLKKKNLGSFCQNDVFCRNIFLLICCSACQLQPSGFTAAEPSGLWGLLKESCGEISDDRQIIPLCPVCVCLVSLAEEKPIDEQFRLLFNGQFPFQHRNFLSQTEIFPH